MTRVRGSSVAFQAQLYSAANPTRRWLHLVRRDWILSAIERHRGPDASLATEVGVGCGIFTRALVKMGYRVTAIDIEPEYLSALAGELGVDLIEADISRYTCAAADLILCTEVLEHLPPPSSIAALENMASAMRPGSVFVLTVPQRYSSMELCARLLRFRPFLALARSMHGEVEELGHTNLLTAAQLERQLAEVGLRVIEKARLGLYLPGIAELGGGSGMRLAQALAERFAHVSWLSGLLWTQAYVLARL